MTSSKLAVTTRTTRLVSLDGLRGLAALSVVAYHYTSRFDELYADAEQRTVLSWAYGYYGVHLFFIISGFVIFMSVEKARRVRDFAISRFIRLFPLYWVCVVITWVVTNAIGPANRSTSLGTMLVNLTMFQSWFGLRDVDGVYWTLAVEMSFYLLMAAGMAAGFLQGRKLAVLLGAWLAVGLVLRSGIAAWLPGHDYLATHLAASYAHLFIAGICLYVGWRDGHSTWTGAGILAAVAIAFLGGGLHEALIIGGLITLVVAGLRGWLPFLAWRPLQVLGGASYALYLLHQNMGYGALTWLEDGLGLSAYLAIPVVTAAAAALAVALTRGWDLPVRTALRRRLQSSPRG